MKPISKKLLLLGCAALATSSMAVTAFAQPQVADFRWGTTIFSNSTQTYQGSGYNTSSLQDLLKNCRPQLGGFGWVQNIIGSGCTGNSNCSGNHWGSCRPSYPGCGQLPGDDDIIGGDRPEVPDVPNKPETPETPDKPNVPDDGDTLAAYAKQVADLVNQERAKAGRSPLKVDVTVQSAAQVRAKEIVSSFSHTRPNGSSFSSALTEAGVSFRGAGENIAYGQSSPEKVMEGWMNSSGHRANILNSSYTSIGVGCYQGAGGTLYWTQLFTY